MQIIYHRFSVDNMRNAIRQSKSMHVKQRHRTSLGKFTHRLEKNGVSCLH